MLALVTRVDIELALYTNYDLLQRIKPLPQRQENNLPLLVDRKDSNLQFNNRTKY